MDAGREMDALIAEKVMGIELPKWIFQEHGLTTKTSREVVPDYSTDIAAAWPIIAIFKRDDMYDHRAAFSNGLRALNIIDLSAEQMAYNICLLALEAIKPKPSWEEIRQQFGKYFDGIDVDVFMRDVRGD